jgi:hypothetical protein
MRALTSPVQRGRTLQIPSRISPTTKAQYLALSQLSNRITLKGSNDVFQGIVRTLILSEDLLCGLRWVVQGVKMGFGLHVGWAIEGAIGSKYKVRLSKMA